MSVGWKETPRSVLLKDGRLGLRHGPIDLIVAAQGDPRAVTGGYERVRAQFETILGDLVGELYLLRAPVGGGQPMPSGAIAGRMARIARRFPADFVTPMAAVAGCVADHMLGVLIGDGGLERAYVNNGGDIALHLAPGASYKAAICTDPTAGGHGGTIEVDWGDPVRGIATSGWRGRSHSLGVADAVSVLARDAGTADVAATLIANAVDVNSSAVVRQPANRLQPDSDLGDRPVTVQVGHLSAAEIDEALDNGERRVTGFVQAGLIEAAFLTLQGRTRVVGERPALLSPHAAIPRHGVDRHA